MKPTLIIDDPVPEPWRALTPEARVRMATWWETEGRPAVEAANRKAGAR